MRIEKKSNQSFRCVLSAKDLEDRQIRLEELAYGSVRTRKLFEDLMWEAEEHYGVSLSGEPLVIEAIPLQNEGLALEFSVMEDSEELDSRYSEFTLAGGSRDTESDVLGADDLLRERSGDYRREPVQKSPDEAPVMDGASVKEGAFVTEEASSTEENESVKEETSEAGPWDAGSELPFLKEAELLDPEETPGTADMAGALRQQIEEGLRKIFPNALVESVDMTTVRVSGTEDMDEFHKKLMKAFADRVRERETENMDGEFDHKEGVLSGGILEEQPTWEAETQKKSGRRGRARQSRQNRENLRLYRFALLEDLLAGAANVAFFEGESSLFHGREGYSLVLRQGDSELRDFNRVCNVLSEYGLGRAATPAAVAYLAEHCKCIFRGDAVGQLVKIGG